MKVTHTIWPVAYYNADGKLTHCLYTFDPSHVRKGYGVSDPVDIEFNHCDPVLNQEQEIKAEIAELQAKLEAMGDE